MFSRVALSCAVLVLTVLLPLPAAHADTYLLFDLGEANPYGIYGIGNDGFVVTAGLSTGPCGATMMSSVECYSLWDMGVLRSQSTVPPPYPYDNGSACAITGVPGVTTGVCNSGREVYFNRFDTPQIAGLFSGPDPTADLIARSASADHIVLDSLGDVAWTDGAREENFEAFDLQSRALMPEPTSLALLGTGALGVVGVLRRRLTQRS